MNCLLQINLQLILQNVKAEEIPFAWIHKYNKIIKQGVGTDHEVKTNHKMMIG